MAGKVYIPDTYLPAIVQAVKDAAAADKGRQAVMLDHVARRVAAAHVHWWEIPSFMEQPAAANVVPLKRKAKR
jgi:nitroimidazol reductase NimA-like FMN-containing flavoprotein (pyridoxamine 5'-phosphate oxidase superfamily)